MCTIILIFWLLRVLTVSQRIFILKAGLPLILLILIIIYVMANHRIFHAYFKSRCFRNYLWLLGLLGVSSFIAFINQMPISYSLEACLKFFLMGCLFLFGFLCALSNKEFRVYTFLYIAIFTHVTIGIIGYYIGLGDEIGNVLRPVGIAGKVNILANIALFSCVYYGIMMVKGNNEIFRNGYLFLCSLFLIFLSASLKNVTSLVAVVLIYLIISAKRKVSLLLLIILIIFPLFYLISKQTPIFERFKVTIEAGIHTDVLEGEKLESSLEWRILHWKLLLNDWYDRFFFWGSGYGQETNMDGLKTAGGAGFNVHNDFIKFFIELGPFLFILFVVFHFKILKEIYLKSKKRSAMETAFFYAVVSQIITMLGGPVYYTIPFFYFFWLLLGVNQGIEYRNNIAGNMTRIHKEPGRKNILFNFSSFS